MADGQFKSALRVKRRRGVYEIMNAKSKALKSLRAIIAAEHYDHLPADVPTYVNIEAPPSVFPAKKYCDVTGFSAKYTDPKTKLRFCSKEAFSVARSLPEHKVQEFLELRGAQSKIK